MLSTSHGETFEILMEIFAKVRALILFVKAKSIIMQRNYSIISYFIFSKHNALFFVYIETITNNGATVQVLSALNYNELTWIHQN